MPDRTIHKILLLTNHNRASGKAVFNALRRECPEVEVRVVVETRSRKWLLLKNRARRYGYARVASQLLFQTVVARAQRFLSRSRVRELSARLDYRAIPDDVKYFVDAVNDQAVIDLANEFQPDLIVVSGTGIIKKRVLEQLNAEVVNLHAGITPEYRGVHGMYWALRHGRPELAGVTLHRVDAGIDTGDILAQARCAATPRDNFVTYPLLQLRRGIDLLVAYVRSGGHPGVILSTGEKGPLYYHPGAGEYLYHALRKGIR